eukprot:395512-Prorocentrum_lima.AAC.1
MGLRHWQVWQRLVMMGKILSQIRVQRGSICQMIVMILTVRQGTCDLHEDAHHGKPGGAELLQL